LSPGRSTTAARFITAAAGASSVGETATGARIRVEEGSRRAEAWGGGDFGAEERCARGGRGKPAMHGDEERGEAMCSR